MASKKLLDSITHPGKLRKCTITQLSEIAELLRSELIETVTESGGHFAPSLGVVELSIALHYCFNTPHDRLIWDVGHQGYIHKMLTGRRSEMHSIRTKDGLSGYLKRTESEFDAFGAGHAGTSISAAVGIRLGLMRRNLEDYAVSIIGDGALTAGMSYEALNHAGALQLDRLVVVLNDNGMSISSNVGALSRQKSLDRFFSSLGFTYLGPLDGHDLNSLVEAIEKAKNIRGPVLLHLKTKKGKGHKEAEQNPCSFHALKSKASVIAVNQTPSYSQVFGKTLTELAKQDSRIVAVTAAMEDGTGLSEFRRVLPESFYDVGICEQHAVTLAAGLACEGAHPVCAIYSSFLQRGFDQLVHDVCIQNLPVVFALDRSGVVGNDGETHQGVFDLAFLRSIPNLAILSPKDENELRHMLFTALAHNGPIAIRYPRGSGTGARIERDFKTIPIGRAEVAAEGEDALIIALGPLVHSALEIRQQLLDRFDINIAVINARSVKPLDKILLCDAVQRFKKVYTLEDHALMAGFSSAVIELINDQGILPHQPITRFGVRDAFVSHASQDEQRKSQGIDSETVLKHIVCECNMGASSPEPPLIAELGELADEMKQVA